MTHAAWVKMMIFHNWKIISSDGHHLFFHFNTQTSNRNYDINSIKSGFSLCNNWAIEHVADFDKDLESTSQSGICDQGRRESNDLGRTDGHKPEFSEKFFGKKWEEHGQDVVREDLVKTRMRVIDPLQSVFKNQIYWSQLAIGNKGLIGHAWR